MSVLAASTAIVDWGAMWKICLVALAAGAGVVIFFGFLLLGLKFAQGPATVSADGTMQSAAKAGRPSAEARLGGFALALVCALVCIGVVAIGVYAMTQKSSSKPAKPKSALVISAGTRLAQVAPSR